MLTATGERSSRPLAVIQILSYNCSTGCSGQSRALCQSSAQHELLTAVLRPGGAGWPQAPIPTALCFPSPSRVQGTWAQPQLENTKGAALGSNEVSLYCT